MPANMTTEKHIDVHCTAKDCEWNRYPHDDCRTVKDARRLAQAHVEHANHETLVVLTTTETFEADSD